MAKKEQAASVPALVVTPEKAPAVSGNFEQIEKYLRKWRERVSEMEMTEDNMAQVRLIKKEAGAYRNSLTKIQNEVKKTYFNDPKSVFEASMGRLLGIVGEVERAADQVLEIEEQERIDGVNEVIDDYIERFQKKYSLDEARLARVERKKSYYNKTAEEKARKDDIEQQFKGLKKAQEADAANIRLIKSACKDEPRLNEQHWIDRLQYGDVASVAEEIAAEKERLRALDAAQETGTASSKAEDADYEVVDGGSAGAVKTVLGTPCSIDFESDFKGRTKSMKIELVYPCDLGDALTQLFAELKKHGVKVRLVKEEAVF
jgi:hypothetical protein